MPTFQEVIDRRELLEPGFEKKRRSAIKAELRKKPGKRKFPVVASLALNDDNTSLSGRVGKGPLLHGAALTAAYVKAFESMNALKSADIAKAKGLQ